MFKTLIIIFSFLISYITADAETLFLKAQNTSDAYSVIDEKLVFFSGSAVEVPDCSHGEFGPHITQAFDKILKKLVFRFHIHREHDTDRCEKFDRQRTEIKVYDKSPDWIHAVEGSKFSYKWKFRLDERFQPSRRFTHLHQIKAVGGTEARMPLITLTARKGRDSKPDRLELRFGKKLKQKTLLKVNLGRFLGRWLEVIERISVGENGKLFFQIKSFKSKDVLFQYENNSIRMWKTSADFLRPKWGIYRSLIEKEVLRDEVVDFADFEIISN